MANFSNISSSSKMNSFDSLPVVPFSYDEALRTSVKLKNKETFQAAAHNVLTWLKRGECTSANSHIFYFMMEIINNQAGKLEAERAKYVEQYNEIIDMVRERSVTVIQLFTEAEKLFETASLENCSQHFTETQKESVEMWKKQTEELKKAMSLLLLNEHEDKKVKLSNPKKKNDANNYNTQDSKHIQYLEESIDCLECQLNVVKNEQAEMRVNFKQEQEENEEKLCVLEAELMNSMTELLNELRRNREIKAELEELRAFKARYEYDFEF